MQFALYTSTRSSNQSLQHPSITGKFANYQEGPTRDHDLRWRQLKRYVAQYPWLQNAYVSCECHLDL